MAKLAVNKLIYYSRVLGYLQPNPFHSRHSTKVRGYCKGLSNTNSGTGAK